MSGEERRSFARGATSGGAMLYKLFSILFSVIFAAAFLMAVFMNPDTSAGFDWPWLLLWAGLGIGAAFLFSRLFSMIKQVTTGMEISIAILLFVLLIGLQFLIIVGMWPAVDSAGYGPVLQMASDNVLDGTRAGSYLLNHPGDAGYYSFLRLYLSFLKLLGIMEYTVPIMLLNAIAVDLTVVLLSFCARRIFDSKKALFILFASVFFAPHLLYMSFSYPELVVLPVPVAAVYLWLKVRTLWRAGNVSGAVGRFCFISLLVGLGTLVKPLVAVIWVAMVIDLLLMLRSGLKFAMMAGGLLVVLAVTFGGMFLMETSPAMPEKTGANGVPTSIGIMMGLNGDGGYSDEDAAAVEALETEQEKAAYISEQISERANNLGLMGMMRHVGRKLAYTFGDGTYQASQVLEQTPAAGSWLVNMFAPGGVGYSGLWAYCFAFSIAIVFWMTVASAKSLYRNNNALAFLRVTIFGATLVLMIWEGGARHLLCFVPLMMLAAVEAAPVPAANRRRALRGADAAEMGGAYGEGAAGAFLEDMETPLEVDPGWQAGDYAQEDNWRDVYPEDWMPEEEAQEQDGALYPDYPPVEMLDGANGEQPQYIEMHAGADDQRRQGAEGAAHGAAGVPPQRWEQLSAEKLDVPPQHWEPLPNRPAGAPYRQQPPAVEGNAPPQRWEPLPSGVPGAPGQPAAGPGNVPPQRWEPLPSGLAGAPPQQRQPEAGAGNAPPQRWEPLPTGTAGMPPQQPPVRQGGAPAPQPRRWEPLPSGTPGAPPPQREQPFAGPAGIPQQQAVPPPAKEPAPQRRWEPLQENAPQRPLDAAASNLPLEPKPAAAAVPPQAAPQPGRVSAVPPFVEQKPAGEAPNIQPPPPVPSPAAQQQGVQPPVDTKPQPAEPAGIPHSPNAVGGEPSTPLQEAPQSAVLDSPQPISVSMPVIDDNLQALLDSIKKDAEAKKKTQGNAKDSVDGNP